MINHRKTILPLTVIVLAAAAPFTQVRAQTAAPPPAAPPPSAPQPPADVMPDMPAGEDRGTRPSEEPDDTTVPVQAPANAGVAPPPGTTVAVPLVFPKVSMAPSRQKRVKPLQTSIGLDPTAPDFGAEADLVSSANDGTANIKPKRWTFVGHLFLRAPLRIGIGPSTSVLNMVGQNSSDQLHSPPHVVGADNTDWNSVGLDPSPTGSLYLSMGNAIVSGTIIIASGTFFDSGYKQLDQMGGISQAYVTMKFSDLFGSRGGLALQAGAFSNRYGLPGPHQNSSGYYNTYLFGRTHVVGEAVTFDYDLTDHVELVVEDGFGSKIEVVPWLQRPVATPYLPDQGPTPQGSNFVHHAHAAILVDDWLQVGAHFMTSWTPNDLQASTGFVPGGQSGHMHVYGGEVHLDLPRFGSAYVGYSRINAVRVLALADGIQVIHASNGVGLTRNYLNPAFNYVYPPIGSQVTAMPPGTVGDSGDIDTVMFQYMVRLARLFDLPATGRDLTLAVYGMFNHVNAPMLPSGSQDKFKFGAEAEFAAFRYLSGGLRFDRVMPNGGNADVAYTALSPRLILHTSWLSREYIILSYTRFFLGSNPQIMQSQYDPVVYPPDKNLLVLSTLVAF
jgi:hypothetical protein